MSMDSSRDNKVKYRRPLNSDQKLVLQWLGKCRFSTSRQLAERLGKSDHKAIQKRLQILEEQGLIGKRYNKSYKLAGRPAEYYLTPRGARRLDKVHELTIKALYKNKTVSDSFITHCLNVTDVALKLRAIYGDKIRLFTDSEIKEHDYMPRWMPDLLVYTKNSKGELYAFLDVWDDTKPFFISVRKARNYLAYLDEGNWPDIYDSNPVILAVCEDQKSQRKLNGQIKRAFNDEDIYDEIFATTTLQELVASTKPVQKIWQVVDPDDRPERISLGSLIS